jgi:hypothetical protein
VTFSSSRLRKKVSLRSRETHRIHLTKTTSTADMRFLSSRRSHHENWLSIAGQAFDERSNYRFVRMTFFIKFI